jgi:cytochrome c oxidase subunit 2
VPVGRTVVFTLESADVIHSFWVPRMGAKRDVVPKHKNTIWWTAFEPGEYYGQCAEFCGTSHADMRLRYFARTPAEFDAWVREQQRPAVEPPPGTLAARGKAVFLNPANQCLACHTVQGTIAQGKQGPDLTHLGSRTTLASAMLENTPQNLEAWIRKPSAFKPRTIMKQIEPAMARLSEEDMRALVAYLGSLR